MRRRISRIAAAALPPAPQLEARAADDTLARLDMEWLRGLLTPGALLEAGTKEGRLQWLQLLDLLAEAPLERLAEREEPERQLVDGQLVAVGPVLVREDLLGRARSSCPTMLDYKVSADNGSMYNTPATYSWYLSGLVFKWLKEQGGVQAMGEMNARKAKKLYGFIDGNDFYANPIEPRFRSWMNVPFTLADDALNAEFLKGAEARHLLNLQGHRSVGGMRASIYNAMPEAGVDALIDYMAEFAKEHG